MKTYAIRYETPWGDIHTAKYRAANSANAIDILVSERSVANILTVKRVK